MKGLTKTKKIALAILSVVMLLCTMFALMPAFSAKAEVTKVEGFTVEKGAYIRNEEPMGIRFTASITKKAYEEIIAQDANAEFGMLIARGEFESSAQAEQVLIENFAQTKHKVSKWDITNNPSSSESVYKYHIAIHNIADENLAKTYAVLGFVTINNVTSYSNITGEGDNIRSPFQVALAHKETYGESMGAEKSFINSVIDKVNNKKANIINGITSENYTQYYGVDYDTNEIVKGSFVSAEQAESIYKVSGNYTGNAVAFTSRCPIHFHVDFPKGKLGEGEVFYVWVAMVAKEGYTPTNSELWQPNAGAQNAIFGFTWDNLYRFANGYKDFNQWHIFEIDLSTVNTKLDAEGNLKLFQGWADSWDASNYTLLIGNFGIRTDVITDGLTAVNYKDYTKNNTSGTFVKSTDISSKYGVTGDYTGNAVVWEAQNNVAYSVKYNKTTLGTSGKFYVWMALVPKENTTPADGGIWQFNGAKEENGIFRFGNSSPATTSLRFNKNNLGKWLKFEVDVSVANTRLATDGMLKLFTSYEYSWTSSNFYILIGNVGVETVA